MHPPPAIDVDPGGAPVWLSAHLFFGGEPEHSRQMGDRVLLELVEPFVRQCQREGWLQQYFFIRYNELGSHIRLRLQGEAEVLARKVRPALEADARLHEAPREDPVSLVFPSAHELLTHARWLPYQPELQRYGGPEGTRVAETFFFHSSEAALALLQPRGAMDSSVRSARALLAMTVLLHALTEEREHAVSLAHLYRDFMLDNFRKMAGPEGSRDDTRWREIFEASHARQAPVLSGPVRALWESMGAREELPAPFEAYHRALVPLRQRLARLHQENLLVVDGRRPEDWPDVTRALVPSYLHMMNNRIGIFAMEEAYLGHLLGKILI